MLNIADSMAPGKANCPIWPSCSMTRMLPRAMVMAMATEITAMEMWSRKNLGTRIFLGNKKKEAKASFFVCLLKGLSVVGCRFVCFLLSVIGWKRGVGRG